MACKTMRLTEFVYEYEKALKNMWVEELEEDFRCKQGTSSQIVKNCGLLEHALSVYTYTFFKRFELEIASNLGSHTKICILIESLLPMKLSKEVVIGFMLSN